MYRVASTAAYSVTISFVLFLVVNDIKTDSLQQTRQHLKGLSIMNILSHPTNSQLKRKASDATGALTFVNVGEQNPTSGNGKPVGSDIEGKSLGVVKPFEPTGFRAPSQNSARTPRLETTKSPSNAPEPVLSNKTSRRNLDSLLSSLSSGVTHDTDTSMDDQRDTGLGQHNFQEQLGSITETEHKHGTGNSLHEGNTDMQNRDQYVTDSEGQFSLGSENNETGDELDLDEKMLITGWRDDDVDLLEEEIAVTSTSKNLYPQDYLECDRCSCYNTQLGTSKDVHARCRHKQFRNSTIPVSLPKDTAFLDLTDNQLRLSSFSIFAIYPVLKFLDLTSNSIQKLEYLPRSPAVEIAYLDLARNNISEIADKSLSLLPNLTYLCLFHNKLAKITNLTFWGLQSLRLLDLSQNNITYIAHGAFDTCTRLETLRLNKNRKLAYTNLSPQLFQPLKYLSLLDIQGLQRQEQSYPHTALAELRSLRTLGIDGIGGAQFAPKMASLHNLTRLSIATNGHCNITNLNASFLQNLPQLTRLDIYHCKLTTISPNIYESVPLLENLTFYFVDCPFDYFFDQLSGLRNSNIRVLAGNALAGSDKNPCRCLTRRHAENLSHMNRLENLALVANRINFVDKDFIDSLPKTIRVLNLRRNMLTHHRSILPLCTSLPNLEVLLEERQNADSYSVAANETIMVQSYTCTSMQSFTSSQPVIMKSYIQNQTSVIDNDRHLLPNPNDTFVVNLTLYSAAESFRFGYHLLYERYSPSYRTRILNVSNCFNGGLRSKELSQWVEIVDISNNSCNSLADNFFHINNSLRGLYMRNNFFGKELSLDVNGGKFAHLQNLEYLDISTNLIHTLPRAVFKGLRSIKILDLSKNNIQLLDVEMSHMTSLMFLDLSHNDLDWITKETRHDLDVIAVQHKVSLDLRLNPLQCTCSSIELFQWFANTKIHILSKDFLTCLDDSKNKQKVGNLRERFAQLQRQCRANTLLLVTTSLSATIVLVIGLSIVLFRNRWRLYYIKNLAITKWYGFKPHGGENKCYAFDAYLLYSGKDWDFVLNECLKELEEKRGHKLYIEDRDFLTGSFIPCNITSAVHNSRLTIPIISPDFLEGEWCEYGLQMAVVESNHTKRNVLHLLIYREVPVEDMSRDLIKVHNDNNFNEYPPDDCSDDVRTAFWDALSRTIGHTSSSDDHPRLIL